MVTTVEINTHRGVRTHQISTINECGYEEQHKKWLFKGLWIRKSAGSCSQIFRALRSHTGAKILTDSIDAFWPELPP